MQILPPTKVVTPIKITASVKKILLHIFQPFTTLTSYHAGKLKSYLLANGCILMKPY